AQVAHAEAGDQGQGEGAVDEQLAELQALGVLDIEVRRIGIAGQQGEPGVVGLRDGAAQPVTIDVADREVLVEASLPAGLDRHGAPGREIRACGRGRARTSGGWGPAVRHARSRRWRGAGAPPPGARCPESIPFSCGTPTGIVLALASALTDGRRSRLLGRA